MKVWVVDASVSLKWVIDDELYSQPALKLQKEFLSGNVNLIAPQLWIHEIINGLKNPGRYSQEAYATKLRQILGSSPNLQDITDLSSFCLKFAFRYNVSGYDSTYLTLAHTRGLTLITADEGIERKISNPNLVIHLSKVYNPLN